MLTRADHYARVHYCPPDGCPWCDGLAEEMSHPEPASDLDADMAAGRAEDAAERWAA